MSPRYVLTLGVFDRTCVRTYLPRCIWSNLCTYLPTLGIFERNYVRIYLPRCVYEPMYEFTFLGMYKRTYVGQQHDTFYAINYVAYT